MSKSTKKMSREEFRKTVNDSRADFGKGAALLTELSTLLSRSDEFTFSGLDASKKFLDQVEELKLAARNVRDAFILRGLTKTSEECTKLTVSKKTP